jgi:hypothetical protein
MKETRDAAAPDTPNAKPADLPDLPLRSRYALLVLAVVLAGLAVFLFLVAIATAAKLPFLAVTLLLPPLIGAAILVWRAFRRAWLRDAGEWWLVSLSEDQKGLRLEWQAQRWRDISPWRNPTAWSEPLRLPWAALPAGGVLVLVYGVAHDDPEAGANSARWAILCVGGFLSLLSIIPPLFVPFQQKAKSIAVLTSETVAYSPPFLSYHPPRGVGIQHAFALGGTSFMRILTRGVRFAPDGVTILAPKLYGFIPMHFIIPTRDPAIRARIRAWAEQHRIRIAGDA